jgi:hypothetical protein
LLLMVMLMFSWNSDEELDLGDSRMSFLLFMMGCWGDYCSGDGGLI